MAIYKDSINLLKQNPIFQLSLASKELFHSNFLYWLFVYNEKEFVELINIMTSYKVKWTNKWNVYREDNHFDLCIRDSESKDYLLVIENKVKSIITNAQLDEYYQKVCKLNKENEDCVFCLLTLATEYLQDREISEDKKWIKISYQDYANALVRVYLQNDIKCDAVNLGIIRHYHQYIDCISKADFFDLPSDDDNWERTNSIDELKEIRIDDLRQKIVANRLALCMLEKLKCDGNVVCNMSDTDIWKDPESHENKDITGKKIYISAGYVNKGALLHISFFATDEVMVRFEIEGNIYKRAVIIKKESSAKIKDDSWIPKVPTDVMRLFSTDLNHEPEIEYNSSIDWESGLKGKIFGTYDMKSLMKYQSRKIPNESKISVVLDCVVNDFCQLYNSIPSCRN